MTSMFKEDQMEEGLEMLGREYKVTEKLEDRFWQAISWWSEWEDWGVLPAEGALYDQPYEWKRARRNRWLLDTNLMR